MIFWVSLRKISPKSGLLEVASHFHQQQMKCKKNIGLGHGSTEHCLYQATLLQHLTMSVPNDLKDFFGVVVCHKQEKAHEQVECYLSWYRVLWHLWLALSRQSMKRNQARFQWMGISPISLITTCIEQTALLFSYQAWHKSWFQVSIAINCIDNLWDIRRNGDRNS